MPVLEPDLSEVGPIAPGTYQARIASVEVTKSKKGNPMIVPDFAVNVNGKERSRSSYLVISGPGATGFLQLLRACHFDEAADAYLNPDTENPSFDSDAFVGQELNVVIEENLYEGEVRDQIRSFLKL
jgi:hypothetical protein